MDAITVEKSYGTKRKIAFLGGFGAEGDTVSAAKAALINSIALAIEGDYTPRLLVYGDDVVLIYRQPQGWMYAFLEPREAGHYTPSGRVWGGWQTAQDVERDVRRHLAQRATDFSDSDSEHSSYLLENDEEGRQEYARWCQWQRRYRELRAQGLSDAEAHNQAWN